MYTMNQCYNVNKLFYTLVYGNSSHNPFRSHTIYGVFLQKDSGEHSDSVFLEEETAILRIFL